MGNKEVIKSEWSIRTCFEQLRREQNPAKGDGAIILTHDQQDEICKMIDQFYIRKTESSKEWAVGKNVKVTANIHGHEFKIGEVVEILVFEESGAPRNLPEWRCKNSKGDDWWLSKEEGVVID